MLLPTFVAVLFFTSLPVSVRAIPATVVANASTTAAPASFYTYANNYTNSYNRVLFPTNIDPPDLSLASACSTQWESEESAFLATANPLATWNYKAEEPW